VFCLDKRLFSTIVVIRTKLSSYKYFGFELFVRFLNKESIKTRNTFGCESNNVYEKSLRKYKDALKLQGVLWVNYSFVISSYCSAVISLSTSLLSDSSTTIIHAFSYGDSFTNSGLSFRSSFTSTTLPLTGA
jgi:Co/Zn/Cd efflux system component